MSREETPLLSPVGFLTQVGDLLDGKEWDASTIETVAELAQLAGAEIRGPDEIETRSVEWQAGYDHGKLQCNHHPEAMTRMKVEKLRVKYIEEGFDTAKLIFGLKASTVELTSKLRKNVNHLRRFIEDAQESTFVVSDILAELEKS